MPLPFQRAYWSELLAIEAKSEGSWELLISRASYSDLEAILNAIATRWAELGKPQERELANV
jgi:hypothetical protein